MAVTRIAAVVGVGQYFRILIAILLAPGRGDSDPDRFVGSLMNLQDTLITYVVDEGPVVYMLLSILGMLGFWWLVAYAALTKWVARRSRKAAE